MVAPMRHTLDAPVCHGWPISEVRTWKQFAEWHDERCAACGGRDPHRGLVEDHCHDTGLARGLLCYSCNTAEGYDSYAWVGPYRRRPPAVMLGYADVYFSASWPNGAEPSPPLESVLGPRPGGYAEAAEYLRLAATGEWEDIWRRRNPSPIVKLFDM